MKPVNIKNESSKLLKVSMLCKNLLIFNNVNKYKLRVQTGQIEVA